MDELLGFIMIIWHQQLAILISDNYDPFGK